MFKTGIFLHTYTINNYWVFLNEKEVIFISSYFPFRNSRINPLVLTGQMADTTREEIK